MEMVTWKRRANLLEQKSEIRRPQAGPGLGVTPRAALGGAKATDPTYSERSKSLNLSIASAYAVSVEVRMMT